MSIDAYIAGRAEFIRINDEITALAANISSVGQALTARREVFSFSNTGVGMPMEVSLVQGNPSADGDRWPSAKQIMERLAAWHAAKNALRNAWQALSPDQQAALHPPPSGVLPRR